MDYSRFNHIGSDSEDDVDEGQGGIHVPSAIAPRMQASTTKTRSDKEGSRQGDAAMTSSARSASEDPVEGASSVTSGSLPQPIMMTASKKGKEGRIKFEHEGSLKLRRSTANILTPPDIEQQYYQYTLHIQ